MGKFLQQYEITVETLSPVFIGSGQKLGKKEYIYDKRKKEAHIIDTAKMYAQLRAFHKVPQYEQYLLFENRDLYFWLRDQGISSKDYQRWIQYTLDCSDAEIYGKNKEILTFMKDVYGNPYIPGSSLKGALRTVLLGDQLMKNHSTSKKMDEISENAKRRANKNLYLLQDARRLETDVFHTIVRKNNYHKSDAVNDELSGLRISDSIPLSVSSLTLCQKIDYHIRGQERKMPLLRECLKPKTKVRFKLTIDRTLCNYTIENILQVMDAVYERNQVFYQKFQLDDPLKEKHMFYLGGGSGFVSKTVEYCAYPERKAIQTVATILRNTTPPVHKHDKDMSYRAAPHVKKITHYSGKQYAFGLCSIEIKKVDF